MIVETPDCFHCGESSIVVIPEELQENYDRWTKGELFLQDAFPSWPPDQREQLKTGIHPKCWDEMFGDHDQEEV